MTIQISEGAPYDKVVFHPHVGDAIADKFGEETVEKMADVGFTFADRIGAE